MQGNWEQKALKAVKWVAIPLAVFGFGFFVIGPAMGGGDDNGSNLTTEPVAQAESNKRPIEPGERKWVPVHPPQVSITVTREVPEKVTEEPIDVPPPEEFIDDDGTVDEGSIGGMRPPVASGKKTDGEGDTGSSQGISTAGG